MTPCGLVACNIYFEFVLLYLIQLTFAREILRSSYPDIAYKHPAPGLGQRHRIRHQRPFPPLPFSLCVISNLRPPSDDYPSQPAVTRLSVCATRMFRFICLSFWIAQRVLIVLSYQVFLSLIVPQARRPCAFSSPGMQPRILLSSFNLPYPI